MGGMRILLFSTIITLLLCASAEARNIRIVVYGDSLTSSKQIQSQEAFAVKLESKLRGIGFDNIDVIDMSVPEGSSANATQRVEDLLAKRPDIVVLAYGLNDALRGVDPSSIYQNVANIVAHLYQRRIYTVLMGVAAPGLGNVYGDRLKFYYQSIAGHYGLPFYENALEGIAGQSKYTAADGYSPNAQGVDIIVEGMYRLVDYGVRWKIEMLQQEEQYKKFIQ